MYILNSNPLDMSVGISLVLCVLRVTRGARISPGLLPLAEITCSMEERTQPTSKIFFTTLPHVLCPSLGRFFFPGAVLRWGPRVVVVPTHTHTLFLVLKFLKIVSVIGLYLVLRPSKFHMKNNIQDGKAVINIVKQCISNNLT